MSRADGHIGNETSRSRPHRRGVPIKRHSLVYGVGNNDADYVVDGKFDGRVGKCPYYRKWTAILERSYSEKYHAGKPTYKECTVVEEWHSFMKFREWMITQDWQGKQLDKDIIFPGNKVYSPETCVFVTSEINALLINNRMNKGRHPRGVTFNKRKGLYSSQFSKNGRDTHLGYFNTSEEAGVAYKTAKRLHLLAIACCETDIRVKQGLYRHSELLR